MHPQLTYLQTFYDSEVAGKEGSASGIGISPDGEYVYVAGEFDNSILRASGKNLR